MGKTGSIEWVKIKGRKGQVRQVAKAETIYKKPGPMQNIRRQVRESRK